MLVEPVGRLTVPTAARTVFAADGKATWFGFLVVAVVVIVIAFVAVGAGPSEDLSHLSLPLRRDVDGMRL